MGIAEERKVQTGGYGLVLEVERDSEAQGPVNETAFMHQRKGRCPQL